MTLNSQFKYLVLKLNFLYYDDMVSCFRKQYKRMLKSAAEFGTESTVMRPTNNGDGRQMCQAYVVPRHEILYNPAFAELREYEGIDDGTTGVINT